MISIETQFEVEQFLFHEAQLLDDLQFDAWLQLFSEDTRYWVPARATTNEMGHGVQDDGELAIFDDDKTFLSARVERLKSDMAHAERPPSRTRHFVSNIQVTEGDGPDVLNVLSNVLVHQSRQERTEIVLVGRRHDHLRRDHGGLLIASRKVVLDHTLLPRSISIFV